MSFVLHERTGTVEEVIAHAKAEFQRILESKRRDAHWKLSSVRQAFESEVVSRLAQQA
jgi:hypothetical protein